MLSGKPFFTKKRIKFILRSVILPLFAIYIGLAIITTIRDMTTKSNEYAAVLFSDHAITKYDYWASPSAFLGAYIPWTYYFNQKNSSKVCCGVVRFSTPSLIRTDRLRSALIPYCLLDILPVPIIASVTDPVFICDL